jgi:hypothetical protein
MRGLRSTLALLVVLIGLGVYIRYFLSSGSDESSSKQEKLFTSFEADKVEELKVKSTSGDVTTLKKEGGAWKIVSPVNAAASESEIVGITSALGQLEITRVVEENPADAKEYGLDAPRIEVEFKAGGGKPPGRLLLGEKNSTGANLYARRNDEKKVVLVAQHHESALNKTTFDLRDKGIVKFDRDKVDGLDTAFDDKSVALSKSGTDWKLTRPLAARADSSAVDGILGRLESAQMKSIVSESATAADLKKYGLEKPPVTVNIHLGSASASVALGGKADDATIYARDASRPGLVVTVEKTLADDLRKQADDYRRKDLFEFRAFNATRIEVARNGQTVAFERVKGQAETSDKWKRVSPTEGEPDKAKVESFLAGLADMRATSFVDAKTKTGLDAPAMTVIAKFDDGKKRSGSLSVRAAPMSTRRALTSRGR